jgi:hypothetical protein
MLKKTSDGIEKAGRSVVRCAMKEVEHMGSVLMEWLLSATERGLGHGTWN